MTTRIGIIGAAGRMGQAVIAAIARRGDCQLSVAVVRPGSTTAPQGWHGIVPCTDLGTAFDAADVVIDFSSAAITQQVVDRARATGIPLVIGTTGLHPVAQENIRQAATTIPIFQAANMSLGVAVLQHLVREAAARLGPDWDVEILDIHHGLKKDVPSGTALSLGRAADEGRRHDGGALSLDRAGPRPAGGVGYAALRGGDVVGEHQVFFLGRGEQICLSHRATDRTIFAEGALQAALWLAKRAPGLYGMGDLIANFSQASQ